MNEPSDKNIDPCGRRTREMFSTRVQYALQLLGDLHVIGCCNLDWLAEQYIKELTFERRLVKMVVARLALLGIFSYEPSLWGEDLYLTVSPEMISMYALVSTMDRRIDFNDPNADEIPNPDESLKKLTVQQVVDTGCVIRETRIRQSAEGRVRLALERDRKDTLGEFMPPTHAAAVAILDDRSRRQRHIDRMGEIMERMDAGAKDV